MWEVIQNRQVCFGAGKAALIPGILREYTDKRALVMAFSSEARRVKAILGALDEAGIEYEFDASLAGEPSTIDVDRIARKAKGCGAVLAIGGGSVLDAAKAAAMLITNGGETADYQMRGKPITQAALKIIACPTTSGTGSEATKVSVVYNPDNGLKKSFYSPYMIADTVILDPELTLDLPKHITVSTGVDALSHAIESYVSLNATPYTRMYGMKAIELIVKSLKACADDPGDITARGDMCLASYFAGCALNAGIGLAHIIAQPLGGIAHIPHGAACAIFLTHAMEYNIEYARDGYCDIARAFGARGENGAALAREGVRRADEFINALGAPRKLGAYLPPDFELERAVDIVAGATGHIKCNPRPVDSAAIRDTIMKAM